MRFRFMRYRKLSYIISGALVLATILSLCFKGLNYGIDFAGGIVMDVKPAAAGYDIAQMRSDLGAWKPEMQQDDRGSVMIRIGLAKDATDEQQNQVVREIKSVLGNRVSYEQIQVVGPKIGGELIRGGIFAVIFAFIMMSVYVWIRYRGGYAIGSLISLSLDFMLMFGFFSVVGLEFSQTAIAVILTGVGYSINDKIVNYDRIMENSKRYIRMPTGELIDLSVNEMLSRTLMTSVSTALGMLALLVFAGNVLGEFAIAMLFCIFMGTLTSIFVSNACLLYFNIRDK
ncbi:MAG: protein translocase subunit SecF [Rickettsiales bacterium]|jgi:preprotein translocase SecF subunit|nr:protein translocase subunit SecF [Rickettsiales bacterium]